MKKSWLALAPIVLVAAYTVPVVPCSLDADTWPINDYESVRAQVITVTPRLSGLHYSIQRTKNEVIPSYQLIGKFGEMKQFHPLLSSKRFGYYEENIKALPALALPDMPYVILDHKKETAMITPAAFNEFMAWAKVAKVDTATMTYIDGKNPSVDAVSKERK